MDLLPNSSKEFGLKEYWDKFFVKLKEEPFEWYGEYEDLAEILHKYVTSKDRLLIIGCGNSSLSYCLHQAGIRDQTNIDISAVVVEQMTHKYPDLKFLVQDVTSMVDFEAERYTCVLDKGTFDALAPPESEDSEAKSKVELMMGEIDRTVKKGGRFVCISLLQPHVAKKLFSFFFGAGWMIRVIRCTQMDKKISDSPDRIAFPVFVNVFTKIKLPVGMKPVIEVSSDSGFRRLGGLDELLESVADAQAMVQLQRELKNIGIGANQEVMVKQYANSGEERYRYYITDCLKLLRNPADKRFGILIVPEGRESEWLFGSHEGRLQLAQDTNFTRLVVVHFVRGQTYESMEKVKDEISGHVRNFMPQSVSDKKCQAPIMTVSNETGTRNIRFKGVSKFSGDFVVEDVTADSSHCYRRLIFLNSPNLIQSEVSLSKVKRQGKVSVNLKRTLSCEHHQIMCIAFGMIRYFYKTESMDALLVGLGGGLLATFIHSFMPKVNLTAIEIDDAIVDVAKTWFGLPKQNDSFQVVVDDGLKYLANTEKQFDLILLDADSKYITDGLSCPPAAFLEEANLRTMKQRLKSNSGILVLNLVCRNSNLKAKYTELISSVFPTVYSYQVGTDVNNLLFCFESSPDGSRKHWNSNVKQSIEWLDSCVADSQKNKTNKVEAEHNDLQWDNTRMKDVFETELDFIKTHFKLLTVAH